MAVVKSTIQELGGTLTRWTPRGGIRDNIHSHLAPHSGDFAGLTGHLQEQRYALPQSSVQEIIAAETGDVKRLENNTLIPYRGGVLPVVAISDILRMPEGSGSPSDRRTRKHIVIIGSDKKAMGLVVDKVTGQREIVVRTISDPQLRIPGIIGATELGDGRPVLILDPEALVRLGKQKKGRRP